MDIDSVKLEKNLKPEERLNHAFDLIPKLKYIYQLYQSLLKIKNGDTDQARVKRFSDWLDDSFRLRYLALNPLLKLY